MIRKPLSDTQKAQARAQIKHAANVVFGGVKSLGSKVKGAITHTKEDEQQRIRIGNQLYRKKK